MTTDELVKAYLLKAEKRLKVLRIFFEEADYSDVIREGQELIEICGKGILRSVGMDVPKWHDVGGLVEELSSKYPELSESLKAFARNSKWLRKEREISFYGDVDFIPTEEYTQEDAAKALQGAAAAFDLLKKFAGV